jgi:type III pantothenate kinase
MIQQTIDCWGLSPSSITDAIIASVNPNLTGCLQKAVTEIFSFMPKIVTAAMKMHLDLSHYDTDLLGSDRIAVCEAAIAKYKAPLIVFDFGTATTVNVVDGCKRFLGGAILPGLTMGINALSKETALLPLIELSPQSPLIGKNTQECIASGAIYGSAAMLDGIVARIEKSLGQEITVVVTGGNATYVVPACEKKFYHEPDLLVEGLYCLYQKNFSCWFK